MMVLARFGKHARGWTSMRLPFLTISCLAFLAAGCIALTGPSGILSPGVWGGEGILLTVTATGATVDYGCDAGTIDEPLTPGSFTASGTYAFGRGGPRHPDDPPLKAHAARYEGTTNGGTMQLAVTLPELSRRVGEFRLVRGRQPLLDRCL